MLNIAETKRLPNILATHSVRNSSVEYPVAGLVRTLLLLKVTSLILKASVVLVKNAIRSRF